MEAETESRWEGTATAEITGPTADQVWSLVEDFCNIHKWFPNMDSCRQVEDQPGMVRHCTIKKSAPVGSGETLTSWANEKVVMITPEERCLVYELLENNIGLNKYVATVKVVPDDRGCKIEWSFVADPVEGWKSDDLISYIRDCLQYMATAMERDLQQTTPQN